MVERSDYSAVTIVNHEGEMGTYHFNHALGLNQEIMGAVEELGYTAPTPVQAGAKEMLPFCPYRSSSSLAARITLFGKSGAELASLLSAVARALVLLPGPLVKSLGIGLVGAFTTLSAFSTECLGFFSDGEVELAAAYIAITSSLLYKERPRIQSVIHLL